VLILLAVAVNLCDLAMPKYLLAQSETDGYSEYIILFMCASLIDVVSHAIKENTVRSVPIDQDRFTFAVSLSQFICGLIISPIIMWINKEFVDFHGSHIIDPTGMSYGQFFGEYLV